MKLKFVVVRRKFHWCNRQWETFVWIFYARFAKWIDQSGPLQSTVGCAMHVYAHTRDWRMQTQQLKNRTSDTLKRKVVQMKNIHSEKKPKQNAERKNTKVERRPSLDTEQLMVSAQLNLLYFHAIGACCFAQIANSTGDHVVSAELHLGLQGNLLITGCPSVRDGEVCSAKSTLAANGDRIRCCIS